MLVERSFRDVGTGEFEVDRDETGIDAGEAATGATLAEEIWAWICADASVASGVGVVAISLTDLEGELVAIGVNSLEEESDVVALEDEEIEVADARTWVGSGEVVAVTVAVAVAVSVSVSVSVV